MVTHVSIPTQGPMQRLGKRRSQKMVATNFGDSHGRAIKRGERRPK